MRYSVLGFNQEKVMQTNLDLTDLLILNYILEACGSPKMMHEIGEDGQPLVWLQHEKMIEDLPILRMAKHSLENRILKLRTNNYLTSKTFSKYKMQGSRTFYGVTELTVSFLYDTTESTSFKNDVVEESTSFEKEANDRALPLKRKSDNLLTRDNILKTTLSKERVSETDPTPYESSQSDFDSHMYTAEDDRPKKKKGKSESLYSKCMREIDNCGETDAVKDLLRQYLPIRLSNTKKPMYGVNQWKGIVTKLSTLKGDHIAIVRYSLENGYASFYEHEDKDEKRRLEVFSETPTMSCKKVTQEEIDNGYFVEGLYY